MIKEIENHDITSTYDIPDDWVIIARGFMWVAFGPKPTLKQRIMKLIKKLKGSE